jgi:endonuclease/exonuclease/phosphatase family metal-dependent hydrolase
LGPEAPSFRDLSVLAEMAVTGSPAILMGDLNFSDQNKGYQILTEAGLEDTFRTAGWGFGSTYPVKDGTVAPRSPWYRIDFVLVTEELCPQRAWVGADGSSDHLPVLATLNW